MRAPLIALALIALAGIAGAAPSGTDYRAIGPGPAIMYDAPGAKARKIYAAPAGMPVEVVITSGEWSRVRDAAGDLAWVESKVLTNKRMLVVEAAQANVRSAPNDSAPVVFTVAKGVLLELAEPVTSSWVKVKHRDGDIGYMKAADVWGE